MNESLAGMVDTYRMDVPTVTPIWEVYQPTQAELDEIDGFDDYERWMKAEIDKPAQPNNPAYMAGWLKHEKDWFAYESWRSYCE